MSARSNGQPLWWVRPFEIIGGYITPLDDEGHFWVGSEDALDDYLVELYERTLRMWTAHERS